MNAKAKCCAEEIYITPSNSVYGDDIQVLFGTKIVQRIGAFKESILDGATEPFCAEVGFALLAFPGKPEGVDCNIYVAITDDSLEEEIRLRVSHSLYGILVNEATAHYGCKSASFYASPETPTAMQCTEYAKHNIAFLDH